jgi:hypothetical protein
MHDTPINAGINQNPEEIGRAAVRMLSAQLNHNEFGMPSVRNETLIEGDWVDGPMLPDRNRPSENLQQRIKLTGMVAVLPETATPAQD